MAKYRIKAYFMHEHEQHAAQQAVNKSIIGDAEWTDGYVIGVVDESRLKALSKKGLVVSIIEKVEASDQGGGPPAPALSSAPMAAPGIFALNAPIETGPDAEKRRPLPVTYQNKKSGSKIISHDPHSVQFYVVRFHGPITKERAKGLRDLAIELQERVTRNKYTVRLKPSQAKSLAEVPFVDSLRLYTEADTLCGGARKTSVAGADSKLRLASTRKASKTGRSQRISLYSVRLHDAKDMPTLVKWLSSKKRKPLWKHHDQLQVALAENSKLLTDLCKRTEVAVVEPIQAAKLCDEPARTLLGLVRNKVELGLQGDGEIIGIADTGIDQSHPDLKKRIAGVSAWGRKNDVSDPEGHGTHVAGCAVGDGTASGGDVLGAAPRAKVYFQSILDANGGLGGLPKNLEELFREAYKNGARIHNNSWGAFSFARYATTSLDVDRFVAANPDMLIVIAAGNDGISIPRVTGSTMSAVNGFVDWPCVAAPATAKNGLTVGASRSSRAQGGYAELTWNDAWPDRYPNPPIAKERISGDDQGLAAFSSRGPSIDWRVKPDVVAPGTDIAAAKSKIAPLHKFWGAYPNNNQYGFMGGTSMAAPYVAGCAALVREWYRKSGNWSTPSAALLKATLINGTQRISGTDALAELAGEPNFHQGFGRIDMSTTIPNTLSPKMKLVFADTWKDQNLNFTDTGQRFRYSVKVGNKMPLRLCLAWTDPAAVGLQHTLTLVVDNASQTKWIGNAQAPSRLNVAGAPQDPNNNVQVIRIDNPPPGDYTIAIFATNLLFPPQSFALVVTGDLKSELKFIA